MGTLADATIDTGRKTVFYRSFVIQQVRLPRRGLFWEWTHENFSRPGQTWHHTTGDCDTLFECIDAVNAWHDSPSAGQVAKEG